MNPNNIKPIDLVEFKYVYCPKIKKEIRLKFVYARHPTGKEGKRTLIDCVGAMKCGVGSIKNKKLLLNFSTCPFENMNFIG